jgi:hypothetical protein
MAAAQTAPAAAAAAPSPHGDAAKPIVESDLTPHIQAHQPFRPRIAGRPIPIAALLFWGGMVLGVIQRYAFNIGADSPLRYIPFLMIIFGVLWFAFVEGVAAVRSYRARQQDG